MARYYLHLHECGSVTLDQEGMDFASSADARDAAIVAAREIMAAELLRGEVCLDCHIEIVDRTGSRRTVVGFDEAVRITQGLCRH